MRHTESCVIIVPEEHKSEVTRRISAIREKDEPKRLEYDCEKLKEELIDEFGVAATTASLVCGKKYGVVGYSPTATAIRNGKSVPYHGEIYLYLWTYIGDGIFHTESAWGAQHESRMPGTPIIELS